MTMNLKKVFISSNHRLYVVPTFWWVFFYPHIRIVELSYYTKKDSYLFSETEVLLFIYLFPTDACASLYFLGDA